ncbi:hypothetical protein NDU88_004183 [Pleurodeles waltl]|uniref:Uncharacterized protein n=1 Tax=Pleurodeles waltl TaxID=8319 RepID=A0AAV7QB65_PLEWA|nr:hypothetical protein NDU88_004183 [Pleurodeles waltl]
MQTADSQARDWARRAASQRQPQNNEAAEIGRQGEAGEEFKGRNAVSNNFWKEPGTWTLSNHSFPFLQESAGTYCCIHPGRQRSHKSQLSGSAAEGRPPPLVLM